MAINLVTFAAQTVTPQDDALIYESALTGSGMIYGGTVTIKSANVLRVAEGHGALCGRKFTIEATDVPVALTPSGSLLGRIYIHMDLADTDEPISIRVETASSLTPVIQDTDVNINNGVYEINLATFTINTSTISNLVNVAPDLQTTQELSKQVSKSGDIYSPNRPYYVGEYVIHDNKLYRCRVACSAAAWSVNQSCFVVASLVDALNRELYEEEDLNVTVHGYITSYLTAKRFGSMIHLTGLFVVNTAIPINTDFLYVQKIGGGVVNAEYVQVPLISIVGQANNTMRMDSNSNRFINNQTQLATGTYNVDCWYKCIFV